MRLFALSGLRLVRFATVLARCALLHALSARRIGERWLGRWPAYAMAPPERLSAAFEELGGTFLKLGQMLALQPDLLPVAWCDALYKLLDRVTPFGFDEAEAILVEELGGGADELFDEFDRCPLATASIGQVHVAHRGGRKLAVKIRRPNAGLEFGADILLMKIAMVLIRRLRLRWFDWLLEPLEEFVTWTEQELDFRYEARYLEELGRQSRQNPKQRVPWVDTAFTTRRTLVMEFLDGVTVLDYLRAVDRGDKVTSRRLERVGFDRERFAAHIVDNFLSQVFVHGVFHADLHPANLVILPGNVVGYLDLGITGALSPFSRRHLVAMTLAYAEGDLERMSEALFQVSVVTDESAAAACRAELSRLAEDWYETVGGRLRLHKPFTLVMLEMLRVSRRAGVWPERDIIKYMRSATAIDGLITRFAPGMDLGSYLRRGCARFIRGEALRGEALTQGALESSALGARLLLTSGPRAAALVDRLTRGELTIPARLTEEGERSSGARRGAALVLGVLLAVALVATPGTDPSPFPNSTVQVLALAAVLVLLVQRLRSPARADSQGG